MPSLAQRAFAKLKVGKKPKRKREKTISQLKKEADRVFSLWIRKRDRWMCFTCGRRGDKYSIQNGHYVSRSHNSLRFDERNCNAQCVADNVFRYGASDDYALALIRKYGPNILQQLAKEKKKIKQFSKAELEEIISKYQ